MMTIAEIVKATIDKIKTDIEAEKARKEASLKGRNVKYPFQIISVKREKKVLGVDAKLFTPTEKEGVSPLELHSGYSRFELTLVDKEIGATPTANIPADDVAYIAQTTRIALQQLLTQKAGAGSGGGKVSIAYTQKLMDRNFQGMTPAEVLLKDPTQEAALLNAKKFLQQNLAKYPNNKHQIDAIDEAIALKNKGELGENTVETPVTDIEIYKTDYKFKSKKNEKGYNLIYGIEITCDTAKKYPFAITIMNCYAPVETSNGGQKHIKMNEAENTVKSTLLMTKMEWYTVIDKMENVKHMFEQMNFATLFEESSIMGRYDATQQDKQ